MRRMLTIGLTLLSFVAALALLPIDAASATVLRGGDVYPYEFSYSDCGFVVDVAGQFSSPRSMARVGKGDKTSAFFGHDNYTVSEVQTRRDTGATVTITIHGLLHDVRATPIGGSIFEFTMMDVTHTEFRAADGTLLSRENGQIRRIIRFDTLGDATPGGTVLELLSEEFRGNFPDFDLCDAFAPN